MITSVENERLRTIRADDYFRTEGGEQVKGSAIIGVITIDTYYDRFPEKRPVTQPQDYTDEDWHETRTPKQIAEADTLRRSGLLRGLKQYCDEHPEALNARALYEEKLTGKRTRPLIPQKTGTMVRLGAIL